MKKVKWSPVTPKNVEVAAAIDHFVKGDRIISNYGTQKEPEYYSGTVLMVSPKRVAVKVHYDDGETHMEPVDNTGLGVIGFMKGKAKFKRAIPVERVLQLVDQDRWHVPALKKLIKGQPTAVNKVTPEIKRQQDVVEKIDKTLPKKSKPKTEQVGKEDFAKQMQTTFDMVRKAVGAPIPKGKDININRPGDAINYDHYFDSVAALDKKININAATMPLLNLGFKKDLTPRSDYNVKTNTWLNAFYGKGMMVIVSVTKDKLYPKVSISVHASLSTEKVDDTKKIKPVEKEKPKQVEAVKGVPRNPIKAKILDHIGFRINGINDGPIGVAEVVDMEDDAFIVASFGRVPFQWYVGYLPFNKTHGNVLYSGGKLTDQQFLDLVETYK